MSNPRGAKKSRIEKSTLLRGSAENGSKGWTDTIIAIAIFAVALSVRLTYLFQIEWIPLFYHLPGDPRVYDEWAGRIAAGDWLGEEVFYQAPLYPYFLGLLRYLFGHDLWLIRVIQMVLSSLSCALLFLAGKFFFSRAVGVAAAVILALYAPGIFFDGLIDKPVLDVFLVSVLLVALGSSLGRPLGRKWLAAGAILALLGLSRENALILALVLPIWIWLYFSRHPPRIRLGWVALFVLGLTFVLFPVGLRNLWVGGEFTLTTSQLGPNFFIGNNASADGTYASIRMAHGEPQFEGQDATRLAERALGRHLSPGEVSRYWLRRSWDYISSQPIDWLLLMGKKWLIVWNVREIEDSDDYYIYQRWSSLLKLLGWVSHFGALAPLAAIGVVLTWGQWRKLWLLYAMLLTLALSLDFFYVFGRYRFPLVPFLAIFAGAGLIEVGRLLRERSALELCGSAALFLAVATAVNWPVMGRPGPSAEGYNNLSNALAKQGRISEAIDSLQQALLVQPSYGVSHYNLGNLYVSTGEIEKAIYHLREAVRLYPRFAEAHSNLGTALAQQGDLEAAVQEFRRALEINPALSGVHLSLGAVWARQGRLAEATESFERALRLNPESVEAHYYLGNMMASQGHLDKAIDHFRQALRIEPEFAEAHEVLARALAMQGKRDEAAQHYQQALRIMKSRRQTPPQR